MPSLTIKDLDEAVLKRLRAKAASAKQGLNQFVKLQIARSVGVQPGVTVYHDLDHLFGRWSAKDVEEFEAATKAFEEIDEEMWR